MINEDVVEYILEARLRDAERAVERARERLTSAEQDLIDAADAYSKFVGVPES